MKAKLAINKSFCVAQHDKRNYTSRTDIDSTNFGGNSSRTPSLAVHLKAEAKIGSPPVACCIQ